MRSENRRERVHSTQRNVEHAFASKVKLFGQLNSVFDITFI